MHVCMCVCVDVYTNDKIRGLSAIKLGNSTYVYIHTRPTKAPCLLYLLTYFYSNLGSVDLRHRLRMLLVRRRRRRTTTVLYYYYSYDYYQH